MSHANPTQQAFLDDQLQMLRRLAEHGLAISAALADSVKEATTKEERNALSLAHARVARSVRLTLMLRSKLFADDALLEAKAQVQAEQDAHAEVEHHKARVERIVERIAKDRTDDEDELDRLVIEAGERLDDEDLYPDLLERPVGELVASLCKDLELKPDWEKLGREPWAKASPFPLDGGKAGIGGDGSAAVTRTGHPHPQPFPHQGGREESHTHHPPDHPQIQPLPS